MSRPLDVFSKPTLHLVVLDDNPYWSDRISSWLKSQAHSWGLCHIEQFHLQTHKCADATSFRETVSKLLDAPPAPGTGRPLVFATLDLVIPERPDEAESEANGIGVVRWCLDRKNGARKLAEAFEFCLISDKDTKLHELSQPGRAGNVGLAEQIRRNGVKVVYKSSLSHDNDAGLEPMWRSIQGLVRRHITHCVVARGNVDKPNEKRMLWFGEPHTPLARLLHQADQVGSKKPGDDDVYLIFADAGGYENDWFRLICQLRGLTPRFLSLGEGRGDEWERPLANPPPALLVRDIVATEHRNRNLAEALERHRFFAKVRANGNLVFFQFPYLESSISIDSRLGGELPLEALRSCVNAVYHSFKINTDTGTGFAFHEHPNAFPFPSYDDLKETGVVRQVIAFHALQNQIDLNLRGVEIDPEVVEVLAEMDWRRHGLSALREHIDGAYRRVKQDGCTPDMVRIDWFRNSEAEVVRDFSDALGFKVRGKRLYALLEHSPAQRPPSADDPPTGSAMLEVLRTIHDLFDRLSRLMALKKSLRQEKRLPGDTEDFRGDVHADSLEKAYAFLKALFETPQALGRQIDDFERHAEKPDWAAHLNPLRDRANWWKEGEGKEYDWPVKRFPLHWAVDVYLQHNGIFAEIHTRLKDVLVRYPEERKKLDALQRQKEEILEDLHHREEQRRRSDHEARLFGHSHPVLGHLQPTDDVEALVNAPFASMLEAHVLYAGAVAICENAYRFGDEHLSRAKVQRAIQAAEVGPTAYLLGDYLEALGEAGKFSESIFATWGPGWAHDGKQPDAYRLAADLARRVADYSKGTLEADERGYIGGLERGSFSHVDLLHAMRIIRNNYHKNTRYPDFDRLHLPDIYELMRRVVVATGKGWRLGVITESGRAFLPWVRRGRPVQETLLRDGLTHDPGTLWMVGESGGQHGLLFPVSDLIRSHPVKGSLWTNYKENKWINLSYQSGDEEGHKLVASKDAPWLPTMDDLKKTRAWNSGHLGKEKRP